MTRLSESAIHIINWSFSKWGRRLKALRKIGPGCDAIETAPNASGVSGATKAGAAPFVPIVRRTAQSPAIRVNGSLRGGARHDGNHFVVNRSAPELFPVMCLVKNSFIRREKWSAAP